MGGAKPWTLEPDGVLVSVRLTPKGGRDDIDGVALLADGRAVLKARVRAAPSEALPMPPWESCLRKRSMSHREA